MSAGDMLRKFCHLAEAVVPHRFDIIDHLDDGTAIPIEALSVDHSIGVYWDVPPGKLRERQHEYGRIGLHELAPVEVSSPTLAGFRNEWYLESAAMRGVQFRAEWLQYLEEGWDASLAEVTYPAATSMALANLIHARSGEAFIYFNPVTPMPLWIRSTPLNSEESGTQVVVQVQSRGRMSPTNIHTECTMEFARQFREQARSYYDPPEPA